MVIVQTCRDGVLVCVDVNTFAAELRAFARSRAAQGDSASLMLTLASDAIDTIVQRIIPVSRGPSEFTDQRASTYTEDHW